MKQLLHPIRLQSDLALSAGISRDAIMTIITKQDRDPEGLSVLSGLIDI